MARLSNAQGLLFAEISTEEVKLQGAAVQTLRGWFGAQQIGQIKSLVTNTVNENKGVVTHTVGDSILSSFADAQSALNTAIEIQRRVAQAQNPTSGVIAKVRVGLAYGPVRVAAGKVSGDSVTAAGILLESAQPNEILVDQAMVDAIGQSREVRFESRGLMEGTTAYRAVSLLSPPRGTHAEAQTVSREPVASPERAMDPVPAAKAPAPDKPIVGTGGATSLVITFAGVERRFWSGEGEILLGRGKDVHVTVPEIHVSRKHAKIVWKDGDGPYLVNLSQNGACVRFASNGREHTCMDKIALEGSGEIALCSRFGQVSSPAEIIKFSLSAT